MQFSEFQYIILKEISLEQTHKPRYIELELVISS